MLILAIESSCDETSSAVVRDGDKVLSNIVASQVEIHSTFGGVVPEIASRRHIEVISSVISQALQKAKVSLIDIEGIAVTRGPGLIGSLLVGLSIAKAISFATKIPYTGVNHLQGHIGAIFLRENYITDSDSDSIKWEKPNFPFMSLVVSGGHTSIYLVNNLLKIQLIGQTRDDAAGEALDKAAKFLNLGYPGGEIIDKLSKNGNENAILFPRPMMKNNFDFSFSGIKTSLLNFLRKRTFFPKNEEIFDIVASFQEAIVDVLITKTLKAALHYKINQIVICGGVAANTRLRKLFFFEAQKKNIKIFFPTIKYCTDNAAMIAVIGNELIKHGKYDDMGLNAISRWPLDIVN